MPRPKPTRGELFKSLLKELILRHKYTDAHLFEHSRVIHLKSEEQWKELQAKSKETKRTLVVMFTASWCDPCRFIAPFFHDLSNKYPCNIFVKLDVDELRSIAVASGTRSIPTFQVYKNGDKADELVGAEDPDLEKFVVKHNVEVELPDDEKPKTLVVATDVIEGTQVANVTSIEHWKELLENSKKSGKMLLVNFWATWNGSGLRLAPLYDSLSVKYSSVVFVKVNVEELEDVAMEEEVDTIPTYKLYKGGKCVDKLEDAIPSALEAMVSKKRR